MPNASSTGRSRTISGSSWINYGREEDEVFIFALVAGKRLADGSFETDLTRVITVNPFTCPQCGYLELYKV